MSVSYQKIAEAFRPTSALVGANEIIHVSCVNNSTAVVDQGIGRKLESLCFCDFGLNGQHSIVHSFHRLIQYMIVNRVRMELREEM